MTHAALGLAAALYVGAALLGWMRSGPQARSGAVPAFLGLGAAAHFAAFYGFHREVPPVPIDSFPAAVALIGWLVVVAYLAAATRAHIGGMAPWVGGVAGLLTATADLGLRLGAPRAGVEAGGWSHAHVLLSAGGFGILTVSTLAGLAYLAKERSLKRKEGARIELPSLESLDRAGHVTLALGFALLTLGVASGFAWAIRHDLEVWTAHTAWLLAAWAVYLLPVGLRTLWRQRGERPARGAVLGFALLAFSYLGIRLIGGAT